MIAAQHLFGLEPGIATALATFVLALVTVVSWFFARRALKQTQRSIEISQRQLEQTQSEIEVSRQEVEEAHRPVLVPVLGDHDLGSTLIVSDDGLFRLPVRNIGAGPALNAEASISLVDDANQPTSGKPGQIPAKVTGIGKNNETLMVIRFPGWGRGQMQNFVLAIEYDDVAKKSWITRGIYFVETKRYDVITVEPNPERKRPRSDMVRPVSLPPN